MLAIARGQTGVMSAWLVVAVVWGATVGAEAARDNEQAPAPLRCTDRDLTSIVEQGLARSATLRELVAHLQRADVIVYVSFSSALPFGTAGRTRFMAAAGRWRYLRTELSNRLPRLDLLALLGHELQHAVEIADAPQVIDSSSLASFYKGIQVGVRSLIVPRFESSFETDAAIATGRRVYFELAGGFW